MTRAGGLGTAASPAIIRENMIYGTGNAGGCAGIYFESDNGSIYTSILNNTIDGVWAAYYAAGIYVGAEGNLTADILGNNITDIESDGDSGAYGMDLHAYGDIAGAISGNYIGDINSYYDAAGISAWADGDFTAPISGNTIIDVNAYDNFEVYAAGIYTGADGSYTGSIYDNVIHDVDAEYAYVADGVRHLGGRVRRVYGQHLQQHRHRHRRRRRRSESSRAASG